MRAGCVAAAIVLLVAAVLACAFFFLVLLRDLDVAWQPPGPGATPAPRPTAVPTPVPDEYLKRVDALNRFQRTQDGDDYLLRYGFIDHHGRRQEVACRIAQADHRKELAGFGYNRGELEAQADAVLQRWIDQELASRGLAPYVQATVRGGYRWQARFPELDSEELARLNVEAERFRGWIEAGFDRKRAEVEDAYLRERGFVLERNTIRIDYFGVVEGAEARLQDCARALAAAATEDSERQRLGLFIAFLQELRYEVPSNPPGREIGGFYPPTEVLVNGHGDCDSKSAAFATLWRRYPGAVLLVEVPGHMLVGVEARPGPGLQSVRIGNRYYLLCEVAGPGKWHPGAKGLSGHFEYWMLEPAGQTLRGESTP